MVDVVDKATRSRMMAAIRAKDTNPEKQLRSALHRIGFRFRKHVKELPGTPDIVLPKWGSVIEVHGCFWHRHEGCHLTARPDDKSGRWLAKFDANVARDQRNLAALRALGWRVAVVWECAIREYGEHVVAERVAGWLQSKAAWKEFGAGQL